MSGNLELKRLAFPNGILENSTREDKLEMRVNRVRDRLHAIYWMHKMQVILKSTALSRSPVNRPIDFNLCANILIVLVVLATACPALASSAPQRHHYDIEIDQAVEIALPENASSVLIGNSDIADVMTQNHSSLVLSGKKIGQTNILVRNQEQLVILDLVIRVSSGDADAITIFHGTMRTDYLCRIDCQEDGTKSIGNIDKSSPPASAITK